MSVVHKELHGSGGDQGSKPDKWYLRIPGGSIYGPVGIAVLADWAAQLRIAPGNEVSQDKKTWQPAESIRELKMEWTADLGQGKKYGPFNVLAVPHLYKNGILPADAKLTNVESGKVVNVHELLKGDASHETNRPSPALQRKKEEKWESLYKEEKAARLQLEAKIQERSEAHKSELDESRKELEKARKELEKVKKDSTKLISKQSAADRKKIEDVAQKEQDIESQLEELKKAAEADASSLKQTAEKLRDAEKKISELEKTKSKLEEAEKSLSSSSLRFEDQDKELKQANARLEKAKKETEELRGKLAEWEQERVAGKDLAEQLRSSERELSSLRESFSDSQSRCKTLEETCGELEKELENVKSDSEERISEMLFGLENMKKELETQKTLYAKIEKTDEEKTRELRKDIEKAYGERDEADSRARAARGDYEKLKKQSEGEKKNLEAVISELKGAVEKANVSAVRREEEKSAVTEKLMTVRRDLHAEIDGLKNELKVHEDREKALEKDTGLRADDAEKAKKALDEAEKKLASQIERINVLQSESAEREDVLRSEIEVLKKEVSRMAGQGDELDKERSRTRELEERLSTAVQSLERMDELETQLADSEKALKEAREKAEKDAEEHGAGVERERARAAELDDRLAAAEKSLEKMGELEAELASRDDVLKEAVEQARQDAEQHRIALEKERQSTKELSEKLATVEDASGRVDLLEGELASRDEKIRQIEQASRVETETLAKELAKTNEQIAGLQRELADAHDKYDVVCADLETERRKETSLSEKMSEAEKRLRSDEELLARTKEEREEDERRRVQLEQKIRAVEEENARIAKELEKSSKNYTKIVREKDIVEGERNDLAGSLQEERGRVSDLQKQVDSLSRLQTGASGELSRLHANMEKINSRLDDTKHRLADKEQEYADLVKRSNSTEKELHAKIKHLEGVSGTSAKVVENLNNQILKYRGEYREYEEKIKKLLAELEEKQEEISDLRNSYEPLLKKSQKHEKDLLKKVARLEAEKARLSRPTPPLSDRVGDIVDKLSIGLGGAEGVLKKYPLLAKVSFSVAAALVCGLLMYWLGIVSGRSGRSETALSGEIPLPMIAPVSEDAVQEEIEEAIEAVITEMENVPEEPDAGLQEFAERAVASVVVANEPVVAEVIESLDLDLDPVGLLPEPSQDQVVEPQEAAPSAVVNPPVTVTATVETKEDSTASQISHKPSWPVIDAPGVNVLYTPKLCRIVFAEGVFSYMTVISEQGRQALGRVADQLGGSTEEFKLIVEGHTDSVPLSDKASVNSNYSLGLRRAKTVVRMLAEDYGLPAEFMIATSMGEKDPPFSNDDPATRRKNRTVVLELIPH